MRNVYYYFANALGTPVVTNATGSICYDADFYLFGGESVFTNTCGQNYKFAGMERDPETGNDHTMFRSYRSNYGRWLSPDPAGLAAADPTNPQSWNRYAYVVNSPTAFTDPTGLDMCQISGVPHGEYGDNRDTPATVSDSCNNMGESSDLGQGIPNWNSWWNDFSAADEGLAPTAQSFLTSANNFIESHTDWDSYASAAGWIAGGGDGYQHPGFAGGSCSPQAGSLSNTCSPGYQFGQEITAASSQYLKYISKLAASPNALQGRGKSYTGKTTLTPVSDPQGPSLTIPNSLKPTCSVSAVMSSFAREITIWIKQNPDESLPAYLLVPPAWVVSCAAP